MNKKLTKELCQMISDKSFDLDIGVETRADTLDSELISLMAKAGVKSVNLGIESPEDQVVQDSGRKPIKEDKLFSVIKELEGNGIKVQAFYILGLIDDTKETIEKTIQYSHFLNTFTAQFCVLTPFPGTKTYVELQDRLLTTDFSKFTEYQPVVQLDHVSSDEIKGYLDKAFNSYYMRPAWLKKNGLSALKNFFKAW
jgi:anaerobic magnesium-protoporphyrin IX monomethyl ester cyclase